MFLYQSGFPLISLVKLYGDRIPDHTLVGFDRKLRREFYFSRLGGDHVLVSKIFIQNDSGVVWKATTDFSNVTNDLRTLVISDFIREYGVIRGYKLH